jgi:DNA-binding PadR family transcriptional regulator
MNYSVTKKVTSMDYAILGLIHQHPQSGYGIQKAFETTALGNYSSSPGAIYPALKRLQKLDLVIKSTYGEKEKNRFSCTKTGINVLKEWSLKPLELHDVAQNLDELLLRFAFMDNLLQKEEKLHFLQSLQRLLKTYITELKTFHNNSAADLPLNGRLAFEHGIASYQATLRWCKKAITTLNKL